MHILDCAFLLPFRTRPAGEASLLISSCVRKEQHIAATEFADLAVSLKRRNFEHVGRRHRKRTAFLRLEGPQL